MPLSIISGKASGFKFQDFPVLISQNYCALLRQQLGIGYQGDAAAAEAKSNSALAEALYGEYVRQIQAAEAARAAAQAQANWEAQFAYQQQQDALAQQNWLTQWEYSQAADKQSSAYKLAASMLRPETAVPSEGQRGPA